MTATRICCSALILTLLLAAGIGCTPQGDQPSSTTTGQEKPRALRVGLVYTAPHTLINQVVAGFKDGLKKEMPNQDVEIIEKHASGDWAQFGPTVDAVLAQDLNLISPITTPISQQALKRAPKSVPICFLAVTDPVGAGLIDSVEKPGKCTGVSDLAPFRKNLQFIRMLMPKAKVIGFPYNPEDQPAVFGMNQVKKLAPEFGFEIQAKAITSKDEIFTLTLEMAKTVDCFLIGSDNMMFEAAPTLVKAGIRNKKPVFAGDSTSIKDGAVGGYTIDYSEVGRQGATLAARILRGERAGDIAAVVLQEGILELNLNSAKEFGITLPPDLVKSAGVVHRAD